MIGLISFAIVTVLAVDVMGHEALYGPAAAIDDFMNSPAASPWVLLYVVVAGVPVVLVHELGHALTARWLLDTPVSIVVGSFGEVAHLHLRRISVSLNAFSSPTAVAGWAQFDASRGQARDILWIALAGPAASAGGLVVSLAALAAAPNGGPLHDLLWATTLGSVFAILNLVPFAYQDRRNGPTHHSDGRVALDAARTLRALR